MAQVNDTVGATTGGNYSYTPETLNEYASMADTAAETIIQLKQDIAKIALEIKRDWKGSSADKYYDNILKYDNDLKLLNDALKEVANRLRDTATRQQERVTDTAAQVESELS